MSWPTQRTAVLVIHGIGQQGSFDTLDKFVRNFRDALEKQYQESPITLAHHVSRYESPEGAWAQNYVSVLQDGDDKTAIDCYEYFWAHETQRKISMAEVFDWLVDTGNKAGQFYDQTPSRRPPATERKGTPFEKGETFDKHLYLKTAGQGLRIIQAVIPVIALAARLPRVGIVVKVATMLFSKLFKTVVEDVIGDVALYTSTDRKSEFFPVRQRIINGAVSRIESLAEEREHGGVADEDAHANPNYERIVIVGHSLGTVVGYDALNRINNRINAGITDPAIAKKLDGFVTFGSPLDKIAYFFRQRGGDEQTVLRQMVDQNASFRSNPVDPAVMQLEPRLESHICDYVGKNMVWVNYWDSKDPISGNLDFYTVNQNKRLYMNKAWGKTHVEYWGFPEMYEHMNDNVIMR